LLKVGSLEFRELVSERYPVWEIKEDMLKNPHLGVVLNAANEVAVEQFLKGNIGFLEISKIILKAYDAFHEVKVDSLETLFQIDAHVRSTIK